MKNFEELRIWQDARFFVGEIYKMMGNNKDFGFKDQLQRASLSIMNNIAEGFDSGSNKEFKRYLQIAKASCGEVRSMLYLCEDFHYGDTEILKVLQDKTNTISAGIYKLIEYLKNK